MPSTQPEYRHTRGGSLNIPLQSGQYSGVSSPMAPSQRFDGPRSPPNTSHVPCKFFRQGQCQAGNACPFSHDISTAAETVCKYFAKGNCKFGPKCANIHILPDGRRINYTRAGIALGPSINLGSRVNPTAYNHSSNSALTNGFARADAYPTGSYTSNDGFNHSMSRQPSMEINIDTTYTSNPTSTYGSPRDDETSRFRGGLSPGNQKIISLMEVGLPASFDSNGISRARYAPWPSSVPAHFESPTPSLNNARDGRTSETLKALHASAYGSSENLPASPLAVNETNMGSSPPTYQTSDEYFGKKPMHSIAMRHAKPRFMSSSAPKVDRDWDPEFLFSEEDCVPDSLANDVLTPQEKMRRGSLRADGDGMGDGISASQSKFGSPIGAGSPSRWGPLFQRQREEEENGGQGKSMKYAASAFGHVGSPLRNSSLPIDGEEFSAIRPHAAGRSTSDSMSALTQQLQRSRLADEGGSSPHLHPNSARAGVGIIGRERERERGLERHTSSGSIGSSAAGRFTTPIEEEDAAFVFSMDEEEETSRSRARKRASGGLGVNGWSYAGILAGKNPNAGKREPASMVESVGGR